MGEQGKRLTKLCTKLCTKVERQAVRDVFKWLDKLRTGSGSDRDEDSVALGSRDTFYAARVLSLSLRPGRYRSRFCIRRPTTEHYLAPLV